jgi:signal transduction histidine kinase
LLLTEKLGPLSEQQKAVLVQSQEAGGRIAAYIEDSLTLSALKINKFAPDFEEARIQDCVHELRSFWSRPFEQRQVVIAIDLDDYIPPFRFDCRKTQRVLSNLLENALQYSKAGDKVTVQVRPYFWDRRHRTSGRVPDRRLQDSDTPNAVAVRVSDQGPGIPEEFRFAVFEEYFRVPRRNAHSHGTGLGLAIARNLVLAMHGEIWLDTEEKNGSHFVVVLPLRH